MRKQPSEPSKASLRAMPEIDPAHLRLLGRGLHRDKALRSFATLLIEREVVDKLGGPENVGEILRTLAKAITKRRKRDAA